MVSGPTPYTLAQSGLESTTRSRSQLPSSGFRKPPFQCGVSSARCLKWASFTGGALIGHHTVIGNFVTIQPGANVAGVCHVGEGTYIGMGAIVLDRIRIGAHSVVGAGAVVTKDVPDHVQVVGVPARIVKESVRGK